ncbi:MAG: hypothetical protein EAX96_17435 [Candidatus Lokiarchaeota archaeon]|nr:hypothetical protein [Candidatus Lokiarchaeota archaeon]
MVSSEQIDVDDLRKILDRKNEKILELQKINAENQKTMINQSEIQRILLEDDKEKILSKKIGELQEKIEILEEKNPIKNDSKTDNKQFDKKQVELMKGAIKKIKNLQVSLEEKNKIIKELKEQTADIREHARLKTELLEKDNLLIKKEKEITNLEAEFVNFKEEFISELKSLEKNEKNDSDQAFKTKELMDKIKDLESKNKKLMEENSSLTNNLQGYKKDIKDLKFILKAKEDQVEQMSSKIDDLLLEKKNGKDIESEINLKMKIRIKELEHTREQIINLAALLGHELPEIINSDKIFEYVDDLLLISDENKLNKLNEWKELTQKSKVALNVELNTKKEEITVTEKRIEDISETAKEIESIMNESPQPTGNVIKKLREHEKEEEMKEILEEEDELRRLIKREIPNITEIEAAILQDQLLGLDVEERNTRIEIYRLTKELEG